MNSAYGARCIHRVPSQGNYLAFLALRMVLSGANQVNSDGAIIKKIVRVLRRVLNLLASITSAPSGDVQTADRRV
jgi:hypothetical protein